MAPRNETALRQEAEEKSQELIQLFNHFDSYREQWDEKAIEWYKLLIGYKEDQDEDDNRSNLHIPRTYQIVDTIRSRIVMAFFKNRPYIDFVPQPSQQNRMSLNAAERKADIASGLIDEQLQKNNIVQKFYDYVTSMLVFPCGILGVGWRYEEDYVKRKVPVPEIIETQFGPKYTGNFVYEPRENNEVIWDDNEITNIDYFDFWTDPKATNIDDARGVFQREFITFDDLMQRMDFLEYLDEGVIYPADYEKLANAGSQYERGREERLAEIGKSTNISDIFNQSKDKELKKNSEFEILHYWEDDRHAMIANRSQVIYDGPSPYWRHRKKPFVVESYERLPNEFYGMSAIQLLEDLQHEENTIHNQRSDNVNFVLNKMWKVRRGADVDESELVSRPHGVVHVDNMEDVEPFEMSDVAASSFQQQNLVAKNMENTLGTPPIIRGASSRGDQTATESMKQSNNAGMRFDVKIQLFRNTGIKRLAYLMDCNNQQFIDGERLVKLGTKDSIEWRSISPEDLVGEYDYRPAGANVDPAANKQVRREQLSQMMQFLMQAGVPFVDYRKLVREWIDSFDVENTQKFLIPQEQFQRQQMMAQQQQPQGQKGMQGNNGQPSQAQQTVNANQGKRRYGRPESRTTKERAGGNIR